MPNLHAIGESLQAAMIPAANEHLIQLKRGAEVSDVFSASSPPIGHSLLVNDASLALSEHDRVFFWEKSLTGQFGLPRIKDIIIDQSDGSEWRVVPTDSNDAWQWHGQTRTMVQVFAKQDSPSNVC